MIQCNLIPQCIPKGIATEIHLDITNTSSGIVTHLLLDLGIPVRLLLIRGNRHVELPRLEPGQTVRNTLVVRGREVGQYDLQLLGFSFRGPDGKINQIRDKNLCIEVSSDTLIDLPDEVRLEVAVGKCSLVAGAWGQLSGWITNRGGRMAEGLVVSLDGPLSCEPVQLEPLKAGSQVPFDMAVHPSQSGERVPVTIKVLSPSGAILFSGRIQLGIGEKQTTQPAFPGGVVIQGSQVDITYGNRSDTKVEGDAVIVNPRDRKDESTNSSGKCPYCGRSVTRGSKFCDSCGKSL